MKRSILSFLFLVSIVKLFAGNIDSLYTVLKNTTTDTARVSLLLKISSEFENSDPEKVISLSREAFFIIREKHKSQPDIRVDAKYSADAVRRAGAGYFLMEDYERSYRMFSLDKRIRLLLGDSGEIVKSYKNLAVLYTSTNKNDSAKICYDIAIRIAKGAGLTDLVADMHRRKGIFYDNTGNADSAISSFLTAIDYYRLVDNKKMIGTMYNLVGNQYKFRSEYEKALEYYQKSLSVKEEANDSAGVSFAYIGIANVFMNWGYFDKARENYQKCYDISVKINNNKGISPALVGLANVYQREGEYLKAIDYYQKSLVIEQLMGNSEGIALAQLNMADAYTKLEMFSRAIGLYNEALVLMERDNNKVRTNLILYMIGNLYHQEKDYDRAIYYFERSIVVAKEIEYNQTVLACLQSLSKVWADKGQYNKAYDYLNEHKTLNDSLFSQEKMAQVTEMQEKYESEKKEKDLLKKDLELTQKEKEAGFQKYIRNVLIAGFIVVIVFAVFVFRGYRQKKKANHVISQKNKLLEQANAEIIAQRDEIESQRDMVVSQKEHIEFIHEEQTSSIRYALRIQQAMLPALEIINKCGLDHFLIYKPRDIVSGDFYWVGKQENNLIIAVADCTGHGVPGAFMSMLGIAFLKEIIMKEYITQPDIVLKKLRKEIVRSLKQNEDANQKDGMDIALCNINLDTFELQFAGANNPLYIVNSYQSAVLSQQSSVNMEADCRLQTADCRLTEVKGDKMPIGIHERMDVFTLHTKQLHKGDCIYMFSDGLADQFGGPAGKKYKYKQLKEQLTINSILSLTDQKINLENSFGNWKGNLEQVDDVTLLGIKI